MRYYPEIPGPRRRAILADLVVVALVASFAWLGLTVNDTFDDAAGLGRGVEEAGNSVQTGFEDAGGFLADVPVVGDELDEAFSDAGAATGGNTAELGVQGAAAIENTALLLGWVTFALPTLAVLLWAVPRRVVRFRRLTAAGRVLAGAHTPSAEECWRCAPPSDSPTRRCFHTPPIPSARSPAVTTSRC